MRAKESLLPDGVHGLLSANGRSARNPPRPKNGCPEILNEPFVDVDEGKRVLELLAQIERKRFECRNRGRQNTNRSSAKSSLRMATMRH